MDHYFAPPVTPHDVPQLLKHIERIRRRVSSGVNFPCWIYGNYAEAKGAMHAVDQAFPLFEAGVVSMAPENSFNKIYLGGIGHVGFLTWFKLHSHMHPCGGDDQKHLMDPMWGILPSLSDLSIEDEYSVKHIGQFDGSRVMRDSMTFMFRDGDAALIERYLRAYETLNHVIRREGEAEMDAAENGQVVSPDVEPSSSPVSVASRVIILERAYHVTTLYDVVQLWFFGTQTKPSYPIHVIFPTSALLAVGSVATTRDGILLQSHAGSLVTHHVQVRLNAGEGNDVDAVVRYRRRGYQTPRSTYRVTIPIDWM